jgi:membrane carboxypeptidase/penicillin-binding protein
MMYVKNVALLCGGIVAAVSVCAILLSAAEVHYVYFDRHNLPDLGPFTRFEFSTIGHIYDAGDRPLIALARERREISRYEDIPPIVRDAILAAEDKRFFPTTGSTISAYPACSGKSDSGCWRDAWRGGAVTTSSAARRSSPRVGPPSRSSLSGGTSSAA